jgi:hypothetical protein
MDLVTNGVYAIIQKRSFKFRTLYNTTDACILLLCIVFMHYYQPVKKKIVNLYGNHYLVLSL